MSLSDIPDLPEVLHKPKVLDVPSVPELSPTADAVLAALIRLVVTLRHRRRTRHGTLDPGRKLTPTAEWVPRRQDRVPAPPAQASTPTSFAAWPSGSNVESGDVLCL